MNRPRPSLRSFCGSGPTGPLPFALPAGAAPAVPVESVPLDAVQLAAAAAAPAAVPSAPAAERPDDGRRSISVKPKRRMEIPEGFAADRTEVRTESGSEIPFRLLVPVPVPGAAK